MTQYNNKLSVRSTINEALTIVRKYPIILMIFLVPAIISLIGNAAISENAGIYFNEVNSNGENINFGDLFPSMGKMMVLSGLVSITTEIVAILVSAIAIVMVADAVAGREVELNKAFDFMKDKWIVLIVAAIIIAVFQFIGILACCIGYVVVIIATVFVKQGIVLDDMQLTESFSKSFDLAKTVWPDVLMIFIVYLISIVVLGFIPYLGSFASPLVGGFFTVVFTLYYIDLTSVPPSEPQPMV